MSITTQSSSTNSKTMHADIEQQIDSHNKTLVIILTVILPAIAFIVIIIAIVLIYRRRHSTIWLKKLENSSRLQAIVVKFSTPTIRTRYSKKKFQQPCTKTIVYNRLSAPATPIACNSENNIAFDECSLKNDQQLILRSPATADPSTTIWQTEFPLSLQAPVPSITTTFVQAIASHRLTLLSNTSLETSPSTTNSDHSRHSGVLHSNASQKVLLFSQRTEF